MAVLVNPAPPCVLFEDEHLLVVNKPAGWNTHAPAPFAGEGVYDWLRHREPRWADLAILHRLDKETSGVMVFGKTPVANRSLTGQFTERAVRKRYLLLTDRKVSRTGFTVESRLVRRGERYASGPGGVEASTRFSVLEEKPGRTLIQAEPMTGRTHQIRVHAAENGFPILGDTLYGGTDAERVCLHAEELVLRHPATGVERTFSAPVDWEADPRLALRSAMVDNAETNACRLIHGASDGWPGWQVEQLGDYLLSQGETAPSIRQLEKLRDLMRTLGARGAYHKLLNRQVRRTSADEASPQLILGDAAPERFVIRENGVMYEAAFNEGYSYGLFLDQRDNRRRFLTGHVAAGFPLHATGASAPEVLNTFAYTCGFSVCAARAGARVTSLDLSRKYLDWGRRNLALNGLDPDAHDFIYGDVFDWMRRLAKKGRRFDTVVLDPPTFSQSKQSGVFRAEKDYGRLVRESLALLRSDGVLLASSNAAGWKPEVFLDTVTAATRSERRKILRQHFAPQPPDFPVSREEPAYLKTVWLKIA